MINWIAEVTMDNTEGWKQSGWFRQVEHRRLRPPFRRLDLGLARCAGLDPASGLRLREPDDRPRSGADLAGRPGGAARRCRARDVSDRLQRRQPGHRRCARAGGRDGRAWGHAGGARRLRRQAVRPDLASSSCAIAAPGRSGCSTSSTNVAAARSTTSTMSSRPGSAPNSWPATRPPRASPSRELNTAPPTIPERCARPRRMMSWHVATARPARSASSCAGEPPQRRGLTRAPIRPQAA